MNFRDLAKRVAKTLGFAQTRDLHRQGHDHEPNLDWLQPSRHPSCLGTLGRFRVTRLLGSGGTGTVLLAEDPTRNRPVALKVLNPALAANPRVVRRFFREAKIAMSVHHPNVVDTYGIDRNTEHPCLISEFMAGGSLQELLDQQGPLPTSIVRDYGIQIAHGLDAIHRMGLVHSDIKPLNVLLDATKKIVKIGDFGLARVARAQAIVQHQTVFATPQYASPEQVQGYKLDHRSDLYSFGGVLYAMCTASPPFPGESAAAIIRNVCNLPPRPIQERNPNVPHWLAEVITRLLAKHRSARYASAVEVARVLAEE